MFPTRNDIDPRAREQLVALLNARLADTLDLASQLKVAHWNVKGPTFFALHELFDKIHGDAADYADELAERAVQLGGLARGTLRHAAAVSKLAEYPEAKDADAHVAAVADALAAYGKSTRAAIELAGELRDADSADLFTEVSRGIDKWLWMVEAHLAR